MSSYEAIAIVTATLRNLLEEAVQIAVPGGGVEIGWPRGHAQDQTRPVVRLSLYSITPNSALRNLGQPVRDSSGAMRTLPALSVDLRYLFSFFGDEQTLAPQRMAGAVMTLLEARPVLIRKDVLDTVRFAPEGGASLSASDVAEHLPLNLVLEPIGADEMARIWALWPQASYVLSLSYRCSVVVLSSALHPQPTRAITTVRAEMSGADGSSETITINAQEPDDA